MEKIIDINNKKVKLAIVIKFLIKVGYFRPRIV
jgi:hypothetical protein